MHFKFWKKKPKEPPKEEKKVVSPLEELCGDDKELYSVLKRTLIEPTRTTIEETIVKAEEFKKKGDKNYARMEFTHAGSLAIYKGDLNLAKSYYRKALEEDPEWPGKWILEYFFSDKAEKAMEIAKAYYSKLEEAKAYYSKLEETKKPEAKPKP